jgi:UDP-glucuronate 4-epimerase
MQAGDVNQTWADVSQLQKDYDYKSSTSVDRGIEAFVNWYKSYFNKN